MDEIVWYVLAGGLIILLAILLYVFINPPKSTERSEALPLPAPPPDAPPQPAYATGPLPMPPLDSWEKALPGGGMETRLPVK